MGFMDFFPNTIPVKVFIGGWEKTFAFPKDQGWDICTALNGKHFMNEEVFRNACNFLVFFDQAMREGKNVRSQMRNTVGGWVQDFGRQKMDFVKLLQSCRKYRFRSPFFKECVHLLEKRIQQYDNEIALKGNLCRFIDEYEKARLG